MGAVKLAEGIHWVGAIDWTMRDFHGFETPRGTTYNAYLIVDETVTLVDAVKAAFVAEMLENVRQLVDPADIGLIVVNHVEMDHSSGLPSAIAAAADARIVASPKGVEGLEKHYQRGWDVEAVKTGDEIGIGKRTLTFLGTPMVHWPDSMFTYVREDRVLLSSDAFGQHLASAARFDDEAFDDPGFMYEAARYFANIVLPYAPQVQNTLAAVAEHGIEPAMIAPSHGVVWRTHIGDIVAAYERWCAGKTHARVAVVYDTMWGSTEKMTRAVSEGVSDAGVRVDVYRLGADPVGTIMTEVMDSAAVLIGSPTLNQGMLPSVAGFVHYVKGLKPRRKLWGAFGSYGWAQMAQKLIRAEVEGLDGEWVGDVAARFVPTEDELAACRSFGGEVARKVLAP